MYGIGMSETPSADVAGRFAGVRPADAVSTPPPPTGRLCRKCGVVICNDHNEIGRTWDGISEYHVNCAPMKFSEIGMPGEGHPVREALAGVIRDASSGEARSQQTAVGPSELGSPCERRLAMRMAGVVPVNRSSDPWPAIVGTAIHAQLREYFEWDNARAIAAGRPARWVTEQRVHPSPVISGSSDLYDRATATVIDWKTVGDGKLPQIVKEGPTLGFQRQIQLYGLGYLRAGFQVNTVALAFLPRAGRLSSLTYYEWPFDPGMAQQTLDRAYRIGSRVVELQRQLGPEIWDRIPGNTEDHCGWCPFFRKNVVRVSSEGCPGVE